MAPFLTVSHLEAALQRQVVGAAASEALDEACQTVRDYLGQQLDFVDNETITLHGTGRATLLLPELPVRAVDLVSVTDPDGAVTALGAADWSLDGVDGILWRSGGIWPAGVHNVAVTYDHGYASVPASIRGVTISLTSRIYHQTATLPGVRSEQLGAHSITYEPTSLAGAGSFRGGGLSGLERLVLDRHKVQRIPAA